MTEGRGASSVVWCEPAPLPPRWVQTLAPLMERPGAWALVRTYDRPQSAHQAAKYLRGARNGSTRSRIPEGCWEFRSQQVDFDAPEWGVWAKYLGPT